MSTPTQTLVKPKETQNINGAQGAEKRVYMTTFKKGHMLHSFHFAHAGNLDSAVQKAKEYLFRNHLMHIHTVPFLIDLDESTSHGYNADGEEIDISKY